MKKMSLIVRLRFLLPVLFCYFTSFQLTAGEDPLRDFPLLRIEIEEKNLADDLSRMVLNTTRARQQCEVSQAARRRIKFYQHRYQELKAHAQSLLKETPWERQSIREKLQRNLRALDTQLALSERDLHSITQSIVRQGCPLTDFDKILEGDLRELFWASMGEGIFVDDHILSVEEFHQRFPYY